MKKNILTAAAFLVIAGSLCSCSNEENINTLSAEELGSKIISECDFPTMYTLPEDDIEGTFGVSSESFSEVYAAVADEYPLIERILVGKLNDNADKEAVKESINENFEALKNDYAGYAPEEYSKAKNTEIYEDGNIMCLVVCTDYNDAMDIIKENY